MPTIVGILTIMSRKTSILGLSDPEKRWIPSYHYTYHHFKFHAEPSWLVGCFGFNSPLRQYFSLYRAVSQKEGEREERIDESKMSKPPPPAPTASATGPCPTVIKIVGRPGTGSLPRTIAPPDHPLQNRVEHEKSFITSGPDQLHILAAAG